MTPGDYWTLLDAAAMLEREETFLRERNADANPILKRECKKIADLAARLRVIAEEERD